MSSREHSYRLSPMQEGILFQVLTHHKKGQYVEQVISELDGHVDLPALETAWNRVIQRHAALRTSFVWDASNSKQIVHPTVPLTLTYFDWTRRIPAEQRSCLERFLATDRDLAFDLRSLPLQRITLVRVAETKWYLIWTWHHILMDAWSSDLVFTEVTDIYRALINGAEPQLNAV